MGFAGTARNGRFSPVKSGFHLSFGKIPPGADSISRTAGFPNVPSALFVNPLIFHKIFTHRQSDDSGRIFRNSGSLENVLCHPFILIHKGFGLWITSVEKPVENVENFDFSTAIFLLPFFPTPVQKFRRAETEFPRKWAVSLPHRKTQPTA